MVTVFVLFSQPSIRGILVALSGLAATTGLSIVYTLSNLMPWRQVALCCLSVPVSTMVAVCFVSILSGISAILSKNCSSKFFVRSTNQSN